MIAKLRAYPAYKESGVEWLGSMPAHWDVDQMSLYGGTKDGLSLDDVKNYPILLPPRHEQEAAVRWIDGRILALAKVSDRTKREIERIREYSTRLIADVVTGKLDVRDAAARLPEAAALIGGDRPHGENQAAEVLRNEGEVATTETEYRSPTRCDSGGAEDEEAPA